MPSKTNGNGFDADSHITKIKGKDYLEVKWRLVWFRHEHPLDSGWGIRTCAEEVTPQGARYRAQVVNPEGLIVAEGTKTETPKGFADYVEKAETGAIGRALAICGYGTQFCGEDLDEGSRIVDSPVNREETPPRPAQAPPADENDWEAEEAAVNEEPEPAPATDSKPARATTRKFKDVRELFLALDELGLRTTKEKLALKQEAGLTATWPEMGQAGWSRVHELAVLQSGGVPE